ncbi:MAG: hypothetical protein QGI10_06275 [Vicinamibacterales bacterium]|nr:hypothetical protein [Vicinamibacterales bacterium]MDP7478856.1 hypothetical protein [Vicinamibacterales bacterium]HJN43369.1 hypothetical protein [Vicinamibacterales bacterium]
MSHPDPIDLTNLAQEKLGRKKTQRVLDHCRECPRCADQLLEAAREQPLTTERPVLGMWNWISIGLLVVSVLAVVAILWWVARSASRPPSPGIEQSQVGASRLPSPLDDRQRT